MSRRSGGAIALGVTALVASWLLGSVPLAVVGLGLGLAGGSSRLWARLARAGVAVERTITAGERVEGGQIRLDFRVRRRVRLPAGAISVRQDAGRLGTPSGRVRHGRAQLVLADVPRGRHVLEPATVSLDDPLGLERVVIGSGSQVELLVRPRIPALRAVFSDAGLSHAGVARSVLRRSSGFELHSVREHQEGEALRAVHWPSTARRGRLMVKELDDTSRDDVVILLDQDPEGVAVGPGGSSFDAIVRAAGALALAHAVRGRKVALVRTEHAAVVLRVRSAAGDWDAALDMLAAVEPCAGRSARTVLADPRTPAARAPELAVVTGDAAGVVEALEARQRDGRRSALVLVDAPTFAGAPGRRADVAALRAVAAGIPVAVLRAGGSLAAELEGAFAEPSRG